MTRKTFFSSMAVGVLAIGLAFGLSAASNVDHVGSATTSTVIHVVEHYNKNVIVDLGPKGDSIGDLNPFDDPLYDANNQNPIGYESGSCIRTIVGKLWECTWTVFLKGGQISLEGPNYDSGADEALAVTGGTGVYTNVHGEMKEHYRGKVGAGTQSDYVFYITY